VIIVKDFGVQLKSKNILGYQTQVYIGTYYLLHTLLRTTSY
jgi:hypothetical protein